MAVSFPTQFHPILYEINSHSFDKLKKITFISSAVFCSIVFAYQMPAIWAITTASVTLISLSAMPKILRHCPSYMIKIALLTSVTSIAILFMGGSVALTILGIKQALLLFLTLDFPLTVFPLFLSTSALAYGIPFFLTSLKNLTHLSIDHEKLHRLTYHTQKFFQNEPQASLILFIHSIFLHFICLNPKMASELFESYNLKRPFYLDSILLSQKEHLNLISQLISEIKAWNTARGEKLPPRTINMYISSICFELQNLEDKELVQAFDLLFMHRQNLVGEKGLDNSDFLRLFNSSLALAGIKKWAYSIIDSINTWQNLKDVVNRFTDQVFELENSYLKNNKNLSPDQEMEFSRKLRELNQQLTSLRGQVHKICLETKLWQDFLLLRSSDEGINFFSTQDIMEDLIRAESLVEHSMLKEIQDAHLSLNKTTKAGDSLSDRLEMMANHFIRDEEPTSSLMFLAAEKDFKTKEIETLQEWLGLTSPHEIEETMTAIGLETEKDLYEKKILLDKGTPKQIIGTNLQHYIETFKKSKKSESKFKGNDHQLLAKVKRVFYSVLTYTIYILPIATPFGMKIFVLGCCYHILKKCDFPLIKAINECFWQIIISNETIKIELAKLDVQKTKVWEKLLKSNTLDTLRFFHWRLSGAMLFFILDSCVAGILGLFLSMRLANKFVDLTFPSDKNAVLP